MKTTVRSDTRDDCVVDGRGRKGSGKRPQLVLVEPYLTGSGHSVLYAGVVAVLKKCFPDLEMSFLGEKEHLGHVSEHLRNTDVRGVRFLPMLRAPSKPGVRRLYYGYRLKQTVGRLIANAELSYVVLLSTSGREFFFLAALAGNRTGRQCYVDLMLHGPNRNNFSWRSRNPVYRASDMISAVHRMDRQFSRLLVLDRHTIGEWKTIAPGLGGLIGALEVALLPEGQPVCSSRPFGEVPIRIGFLGQATSGKGFPRFVRYADEASARFGNALQFHLIGRLSAKLAETPTGPVVLHWSRPQQVGCAPDQMPREKYLSLLNQMDIVCLPYEGDYYLTGASGVFFDAINAGKPIIASNIPFVEAAFSEFGPIGVLCESDDEMLEAILSIGRQDQLLDWDGFYTNIQALRSHHGPDAVSARFAAWVQGDRPSLAQAMRLQPAQSQDAEERQA